MTGGMSEDAPSPAPELSILVVSYNTKAMTLAALRSVLAETRKTSFELIVVDNASTDGSAEAIAGLGGPVRLISSPDNLGFARANNFAAKSARGKFVLLLNPDTLVLDSAIDKLMAFQRQRPDALIWGGKTVFADGRLNPASCWRQMSLWNLFCRTAFLTALFPKSPLCNSESYGGWDRSGIREVDIVSGCYLLIGADLWRTLGGFDPLFFMYGEEANLCLRAKALGAKPAVTDASVIVHYGGVSEKTRAGKVVKLFQAKVSLIQRHMPSWQHRPALALMALWPLTRWLSGAAIARLKPSPARAESAAAWAEVFKRRSEWLGGYPKISPAIDASPAGQPA